MLKAFKLDELLKIVPGKMFQKGNSLTIEHIAIDSRKIVSGSSSLYIALPGFKFDGHAFITSAYDLGVRNFIINEDQLPDLQFPDANILAVPDPLEALQKIAQWNRSFFKGPVIGITGSNGKTIVKEWLGQVLSTAYSVAKSPKSYNSQIGVPLSIFGIEPYHKVSILEAGISRRAEMEKLEQMIQPSMGLFTNIGTAHEEGFESKNEKLEEKIKLFANSHFIIYRKDQSEVAKLLEVQFPLEKLISWSALPGADYTLSVKRNEDRSKIILMQPNLSLFTFQTSFTDEASLENLRHVIVACLTLGMTPKEIDEGIQELRPIEMRLTLKQGINNSTLIDDTYNNDVGGLGVALEFLENQRPKRRKVLILSDLLQARDSSQVYPQVRDLLQHYHIDFLFGVGSEIQFLQSAFPGKSLFFPDTESLIRALDPNTFENDLILIKGARKFEFEQIVNVLQERIHGTTLEINLNALSHNYNFYKKRLHPNTKIMVMVKAFAYGGGSAEIANHLQQLKADYLAVAYTDEGIYLRNQGIQLPIIVLNPERESFHNLLKFNLDPVVYSLQFFHQLGKICQQQKTSTNIHLDLDTGMHRLGFEKTDMDELRKLILQFPELKITSIYTHLAGADEPAHQDFSLGQLESFKEMCKKIKSYIDYHPLRHALNSAGIIRYPEFQFEMVRLGIGLYGVEVNGLYELALRPISTLKTTISQIKTLSKGQSVGYGRKGQMPEDGRIATIPIGYADGYDRRFGNGKGFVLIKDKKAPVIGNVCMDMCMVNITGIDAHIGDEVLIYGENISLKALAEAIGTIPYELLTNISNRVKRVYYLD
ncbi:MAG: bifunctional UDP-N-acetylmuramoyl-tripeptide:D-alanyl-D-alanine ligase/alanine racemase [Anditalea sp.]